MAKYAIVAFWAILLLAQPGLHRQSKDCQKEEAGKKREVCHDIIDNHFYVCKKDYCGKGDWSPLISGKGRKA